MGHDLKASMASGIAKSDVMLALLSSDYQRSRQCMFEMRCIAGLDHEATAQRDAARDRLEAASAELAEARVRSADAVARAQRDNTEALIKCAKKQRALDAAVTTANEDTIESSTAAFDSVRADERQIRADGLQRQAAARALEEVAAAAVLAAEVALAKELSSHLAASQGGAAGEAATARLTAARAELAEAQVRAAAADAQAEREVAEARATTAKLQCSLADSVTMGNETVINVVTEALSSARASEQRVLAKGAQHAAAARTACEAATSAAQQAEAESARVALAARGAAAAAALERRKPLVCCVVEPGMWVSWAPSDELKELAGLSSHLCACMRARARAGPCARARLHAPPTRALPSPQPAPPLPCPRRRGRERRQPRRLQRRGRARGGAPQADARREGAPEGARARRRGAPARGGRRRARR